MTVPAQTHTHHDPLRRILQRIKRRRIDRGQSLHTMTPQERLGALCRAAERMGVLR